MKRLGIIDWGIGGIGVYKLVKEILPGVSVSYLSDTGAIPYGKMPRNELVERLNSAINYLVSKGVTHLVIGCNAASTAIPFLDDSGIRIEGMIDSAVTSVSKLKPKRLGLIGGRRTVVSGVYRRGFKKMGIVLEQRIAQPLSALIEAGDLSSDHLKIECRRILSPLKSCSHILLACTHYPAITEVMRQFVSPSTKLIDPAGELIERVTAWNLPAGATDIFLTTGDALQMKKAAFAAFGVEIAEVESVSI